MDLTCAEVFTQDRFYWRRVEVMSPSACPSMRPRVVEIRVTPLHSRQITVLQRDAVLRGGCNVRCYRASEAVIGAL